MLKWSKKTKHVGVTYPLLTALVCAGSRSFFKGRFREILDLLLPKVRSKDHRLGTLQCLLHLLGAHLNHQCGSQVLLRPPGRSDSPTDPHTTDMLSISCVHPLAHAPGHASAELSGAEHSAGGSAAPLSPARHKPSPGDGSGHSPRPGSAKAYSSPRKDSLGSETSSPATTSPMRTVSPSVDGAEGSAAEPATRETLGAHHRGYPASGATTPVSQLLGPGGSASVTPVMQSPQTHTLQAPSISSPMTSLGCVNYSSARHALSPTDGSASNVSPKFADVVLPATSSAPQCLDVDDKVVRAALHGNADGAHGKDNGRVVHTVEETSNEPQQYVPRPLLSGDKPTPLRMGLGGLEARKKFVYPNSCSNFGPLSQISLFS